MYRLKLLGALEIEALDDSTLERAAQPRQLALLALLAASSSPLTRDKVIGHLWPEEEERSARRRLSDALYVLRQELGDDSVRVIGDSLTLNRSVISSDLSDYEEALGGGDLERAVSLYSGPFLDGVFLSDTVEFERWVDGERERLARRQRAAIETLASGAEERGDLGEAVGWWRRLVSLDPYSSRAVKRLMQALVRSGDRPAALKAARAHELLLRSELRASPDPELVALVKRLRSPEPDHDTVGQVAALPSSPPGPRTGDGTATRGSNGRQTAAIVGGVLLGLLLGLGLLRLGSAARGGAPPDQDARRAIVVLPWTVRGEATGLEHLEQGLVDLVSLSLGEHSVVDPVDPYAVVRFVERSCDVPADPRCGAEAAARFGADRFVIGSVVPAASRTLQLCISVHDASGTEVGHTTVSADPADLPGAVDEVGRRIAALLPPARDASDPRPHPRPLAVRTTASPSALRAYLEGTSRFRASDPDGSIRALRQAVARDSGFALAWHRMALVAEIRGGRDSWRLADSAADRALAGADRLSDRHRKLLGAFDHLRRGRAERAERGLREVLAAHPNEFEAWYLLGEVQHHYTIVRGRPPDGEHAFRRALDIDPDFRGALWHLRLEALSKGRISQFDSLTRHFLALAPGADENSPADRSPFERSFRDLEILYARLARADHRLVGLVRAEEDSSRQRWFAELENADEHELLWIVGMHYENLSWPGRLSDAVRAARILTRSSRPARARARGFVGLGSIALREGRWRDAFARLDSLATIDPVLAALWRAEWASSLFLPLPAEVLSAVRADLAGLLERPPPASTTELPVGPIGWTITPPYGRATWGLTQLALLSVRLGEDGRAREHAAELAARLEARHPGHGSLAEDVRKALHSESLLRRGDPEGARATLDRIRYEVRCDELSSGLYPQLFLRAEVLFALGELEEARRWYALWTHLPGSRFLGPALRRLGQIHEATDEPEEALSRYEEFVSLWTDADPELQPVVTEARERIAALQRARREGMAALLRRVPGRPRMRSADVEARSLRHRRSTPRGGR